MTAASIYSVLIALGLLRFMQDRWLYGPRLAEAAYRRPVLVGQWIADWRLVLPVVAVSLPGVIAPSATSWAALGEPLRWVAAVLVASLAWPYATYARNLFLGATAHALDRLLLLALGAACIVHPVALGPFLAHLLVMARQFEHPSFIRYSFTAARLPLDLLMLLSAWPAAVVLVAPPQATLIVLLLAAAASLYVVPGLAKAALGPWPGSWAVLNRTHRLFVSSHQQGWLSRLSAERVLRAARALAPLDRPIGIATLALELGAAFLLAGRELAVAILLANIALHACILAASGINFWKWAVADAALAWLLIGLPPETAAAVFRPEHLAVAIAIIATHSLHQRCPRLGWLDTPLNNFFIIEAIGPDGRARRVPRVFFAPHDMPFAQDRHYHLEPGRLLVGTYGVTVGSPRSATRVHAALASCSGEPAEIERIRADLGRCEHDPRAAAEFDRFMVEFFARVNAAIRPGAGSGTGPRGLASLRGWWTRLAPPVHIWSCWQGPDVYFGREPVEAVRVRFVETWYDQAAGRIRTLTDRVVRQVLIQPHDLDAHAAPVPALAA